MKPPFSSELGRRELADALRAALLLAKDARDQAAPLPPLETLDSWGGVMANLMHLCDYLWKQRPSSEVEAE